MMEYTDNTFALSGATRRCQQISQNIKDHMVQPVCMINNHVFYRHKRSHIVWFGDEGWAWRSTIAAI